MNVINLIFRATTTSLDTAKAKLEQVKKSTSDATTNTARLKTSFDNLRGAGGPLGDVTNKLTDMSGTLAAVGRAAVALPPLFIAAVGAAGIFAALRFQSTLDELDKMAVQFGYTADAATLLEDKLQGRGGLAGFERDIQRVTRALNRADEESSAAYEAFETLGVNVSTATQPLQVLSELTERYGERVKQGNLTIEEQGALQVALGQNWKETIFRQMEAAEALQMYNEFAEQGIGISQAGLDATTDYNNELDAMSFIFKVMGSQLVGDVLPAFTSLVGALVSSYENGGLVRIAFEGLRLATNVLMVPVRALFNMFIQLDAILQSVTTSAVALFDSIRTRSGDPLRGLRDNLAKIWNDANSRTLSPWGMSDSAPAAQQTPGTGAAPSGTRAINRRPNTEAVKAAKDAAKAEQDMLNARAARAMADIERYEAAEAAADAELRSLQQIARGYMDLIDPLNAYTLKLEEIRMLRERGIITLEQQLDMELEVEIQRSAALDKSIVKQKEMTEETNLGLEATKFVAGEISNSIGQAFASGEFSFRSFLSTVLKGLAQMIFQLTVMKPLMTWFEGAFKGGGWGGVTSGIRSFFGFANGGRPPVGQASIVGERGPEMFVPDTAGTIVPNYKMNGGSAGVSIGSISIVVEGGNTNEETAAALRKELLETMNKVADGRIANARRSGGLLNPT